jgi:hypothetical protein
MEQSSRRRRWMPRFMRMILGGRAVQGQVFSKESRSLFPSNQQHAITDLRIQIERFQHKSSSDVGNALFVSANR